MQWTQWVLVSTGGMLFLGLTGFGILSIRERERRAAFVSFLLAAISAGLFALLALAPQALQVIGAGATLTGAAGALVLFLWPMGKPARGADQPTMRFDERDVIFTRFFRIRPGTPEFEAYYQMRPEKRPGDDLTRTRPGLNAPGSLYYHPVLSAAVDASFFLTEHLSGGVDGPVAPQPMQLAPGEAAGFIRRLAAYYGALDTGITRLQPYHVYSHVGRGPGKYGEPVDLQHTYAIACTVEMEHAMIGPNPALQGSMESARQYVEAARVAVQLAAFIRRLGYPARAHIDGNYQVICPLVARDAGLGEIGRMGLLMTPTHGPRVRLAVVTTTLELEPDTRSNDCSVLDFCLHCQKCVANCPSHSIPTGERQEIDGALRWQIDSDTCFRYWMTSGTDCGRCMTVCPYSHPHSLGHNLVRWAARRSGFSRRAMLLLDDLFYGRQPERRPVPGWTNIEVRETGESQ